MSRFRAKPLIVEAVQWFPGAHVVGVQELVYGDIEQGNAESSGYGMIDTPEGPIRVEPGDWIITGVKREIHSMPDEIFKLTYEPVD